MVKSLQLPTTEVDSKWELCRAKWYFNLYSLRQQQYSFQTLLPHFNFLMLKDFLPKNLELGAIEREDSGSDSNGWLQCENVGIAQASDLQEGSQNH